METAKDMLEQITILLSAYKSGHFLSGGSHTIYLSTAVVESFAEVIRLMHVSGERELPDTCME